MTTNEQPAAGEHEEVIHECAGIREMNNPLPLWWLFTFFGAVVFAFGYFFYFEVFHVGKTNEQELEADMAPDRARAAAEAKEIAAVTDDALLAMSKDASAVKEGEATFKALCVPCHGDKAEGKIGPNLTDNHFIHGAKPTDAFKTIAFGVGDKGMPAWGKTIGIAKAKSAAAYVVSLKGKNVAGKAPEGTPELM